MSGLLSHATVLGGGAYGTALAQVLARKGLIVSMWIREPEVVESINFLHENTVFLKDVPLHDNIKAYSNISQSLAHAEIVLIVIPTPFLRRVMVENRSTLPVGVPLVCCAKGIENESLLCPYEILIEELPGKYHHWIAALSGPSFAEEVARGQPTSVLVAAKSEDVAKIIQTAISDEMFRIYTGNDVIGAELGGAVKNVLAIACGAASGAGFGSNTAALLMTRGLMEMTRLAVKKGASPLTLLGLAGVGDLVLTCTSVKSRNFSVGQRVARGESMESVLSGVVVAEGVKTAESIHEMALKLGVEMPICEEVYLVLHRGKPFLQSMMDLKARPLTHEADGFALLSHINLLQPPSSPPQQSRM